MRKFSEYLYQIKNRQAHIATILDLLYRIANKFLPGHITSITKIARIFVQGYSQKDSSLEVIFEDLHKAADKIKPRERTRDRVLALKEFQEQLSLLRNFVLNKKSE